MLTSILRECNLSVAATRF